MPYTFNTFPDYLAAIRQKPGMYIGGRSVTSLYLFLAGFGTAEDHYAIPENERLGGFDFAAFEDWVARKYNPQQLTLRSYSLAREAAGSEDAGFALWFQWYDEYRSTDVPADRAVG